MDRPVARMPTGTKMRTIKLDQAVEMIPDGATLMVGGFMGIGSPELVIDELVRQQKKNLTIIANDTAKPGVGVGKLVSASTEPPKCAAICASSGDPGATTSRASRSVSITGTPRAANRFATVVLPLAMPPVSPMRKAPRIRGQRGSYSAR